MKYALIEPLETRYAPSVVSIALVNNPSGAATEGNTVKFVLTLDGETDADVEVTLAADLLPGLGHAAAADFTLPSMPIVIAAHQLSKEFDVMIDNDDLHEDAETFAVKIAAVNNGTAVIDQSAPPMVTIAANDQDQLPTVSLDPTASALEGTSGTTSFPFVLRLDKPSGVPIQVHVFTQNDTGDHPADSGDYSIVTDAIVTINPGETSATYNVQVTGDPNPEPDETFQLKLGDVGSNAMRSTNDTAIGTILDDESARITIDNPVENPVTEGPNKSFTFKVHLNAAQTQDVTVTYMTVNGTATGGQDFNAIASGTTVTFAAGETDKDITVTVLDDTIHEQQESFTVKLTNTSLGTIATDTATGTIADNDAAPTPTIFGPDPAHQSGTITIDEADSARAYAFTITLDHASSTPFTVHLTSSPGAAGQTAATEGVDYVKFDQDITFAAGETSKTFSLNVLGDTTDESDEALSLTFTAKSGDVTIPASTVVILANDEVKIEVADALILEGNTGTKTLNFPVTLSKATDHPVTFKYATSPGTASTSDFTAKTGTVTIAAGQTTGTISIDILGDAIGETDEVFNVTLSEATGAVLKQTVVHGTIDNDDDFLSISDVQIVEGATGTNKTMVFTVTLERAPGTPGTVTMNYQTSDSTATAGSDYTALPSTLLTFAPNETMKMISVTVLGDAVDEQDETFKVTLSNVVGISTTDQKLVGTGTIIDDENLLTVSDASVVEGDSGTLNMVFTVNLTNRVGTGTITVNYFTSDGTAIAGVDYNAIPSTTLTFANGETSKTISVPIRGDLVREGNETFTLNFATPSGASLSATSVTGTITDNDPLPTFSVSGGSISEDGGSLVFTINLNGASQSPVTVDFDTGDGTATLADHDYTQTHQTLTFAPGQTTTTVLVPITADTTAEGDETVLGKLSNAQGASIGTSSAPGTIREDDIKASLSVSDLATPITEGNTGTTTKHITVTLSSPALPGKPVTVNFAVTGGTAVAGTDFVLPTATTLTFAPGEQTKTIDIDIKGDNIHEGDEKFTVALTGATNAVVDPAPANNLGQVTIADDDGIPTVSIADASFTEGNAQAPMTFTLTLSNPTTSTVTVHLKTIAGTAGALSDFIAINDQLVTFAPGQTTQTVTVQVVGDQIDEPTETFTVELSNPSKDDSNNPTLALGDSTATGTILDNDLRLLTINDKTMAEGNSGRTVMQFTVSLSSIEGLSPGAYQTVKVRYTLEDDTAKAGTDYVSLASGILTFAPGETAKTISVEINGDTTVEPDEHFLIRLSADPVEPLNTIISDNLGIGTIQNDESQYSLGAAVVAGNEEAATGGGDNTLTFTVKRTGDLTQTGSVIVSTADGTAKSTGERPDFFARTTTLVFAPGEESKPFTVTLKHDLNYENDETFSVQLSDATNGNGAIDPLLKVQTGKILNNDARPTVKIVDAPATVEGALNGTNKLNFTVQLVTNVNGTDVVVADETEVVTVKWHTAGIDEDSTQTARGTPTAKFAKDFEQTVAGEFTFDFSQSGASGSKTISIPIVGDDVDENDETMAVKIDSAKGTGTPTDLVISRGTAHGLILDDDAAPVLVFGGATNGVYSVPESSATFNPTLQLFTQAGGSATYSEKDITFTFTIVPGTATAGSDYTFSGPNTMTVTIHAGDMSQSLNFGIINDTIDESDETFSFKLSNAQNVRFSNSTAPVTITDDDATPTLVIANAQITEGDSGQTNMVFTVNLTGTADKAITVNYKTTDGTGAAAAVSVGGLPDFVATSGLLTFAPGETSKTISVAIFGDPWLESDETFTMGLSSATNATIATATATGTILNGNDSVVGIIVQDASSIEDPFTVNSGTTTQTQHPTITFKIELTKAIGTDVTFLAQTRNGTAIATGQADADFLALNATQVTIAANQTSTTVQVEIVPDFKAASQNGVFEATESFFLGIGGISSNAGAARQEARGTILNDDFTFLDQKTLLYVDEDGDLAKVKISKGAFSAASITFGRINQSTGGRTLQLIDFTGNPALFNGTDFIVTVEPQIGFAASGKTTDGQVNIGFIRGAIPDTETLQFSHGIDFRNIVVPGDVAKITAGDLFTTPSILGGIKVKSLGVHTDTGAPNTTSQFLSTINSFQIEGDMMGILQVLGNQFGSINSLKIGGALRGTAIDSSNNPVLSGVIAFTGTLKSATIGDIIGGAVSDSGSITAYTDFTARIGTLHVLGDITGGTGTRSGGVVAKSIGAVTVDGSVIGGGGTGFDQVNGVDTTIRKGSNSGVIRSLTTIGTVRIDGDLKGGIQSDTGLVVAGATINAVHIGGSLLGGTGLLDAGALVVGQNLTTLIIDGDVVGSSGERSATVQVGTAQNLSTTPTFPIFIKNLTVGSADGTGGDIRGGSGVDSGTITSGAGFSSSNYSVRGGTIGNALIYGDIIGGTGEGASSARSGDSTGGVQAGSTITKLDIRGSIIGGDSPGATGSVAGADLVRSGFVVAGRIAQMIVGGDLVAGHDFGLGIADSGSIRVRNDIASLIIRGNVIGNETNSAVISAGGNGPVVDGKASPAIGSLTLGSSTANSVSFLNVLAGYGTDGTVAAPLGQKLTADVQIGTVNIKGDMKATNIVAGAEPGTDGSFGTGDDFAFISSSAVVNNPRILSSIAKVIIGGNVLASDDSYGIVAQLVSVVTVPGTPVTLSAGASNDFQELGTETKVTVNEVE